MTSPIAQERQATIILKLVNLTGHSLKLTDGRGIVVIPAHGEKARVVSKSKLVRRIKIDGLTHALRVSELTEQYVVGLPEPADDTVFIVSGLVVSHTRERDDVVAPGQLDRDEKTGRVRGCRGFITKGEINGEEAD